MQVLTKTTRRVITTFTILLLSGSSVIAADKPVFSGPQVGEKLPPLKIKGVYGKDAGKDLALVKLAEGKPTVLIFMHKLTRPAFATLNTILNYSATQKSKKVFTAMVLLTDDATAGEAQLKRLQRYLQSKQKSTRIGFSPDGKEGPGAYGLNRNVTLTILVANKGKVTANYALVQPSVEVDVMKVIKDVVKHTGGKIPKLDDIFKRRYANKKKKKRKPAKERDAIVTANIRPFIQKDATDKELDAIAKKIEERAKKAPKSKTDIAFYAGVILRQKYGTKHAQEIARRWLKEYSPAERPKKKD
jgi:hypothetical protein